MVRFPQRQIFLLVALCLAVGVPNVVLSGTSLAPYMQLVSSTLACLAAVLCGVAARRVVAAVRTGWALLAAGCLGWGLGNFYWSWNELVLRESVLFPSIADAGYLMFPVLGAAGLWLISGWTWAGSRLTVLLDGMIAGCALFVVGWVGVIRSVWEAGADTPFAFVVSMAYPVSDIVLATMAVLIAARARGGGRDIGVLLVLGLAAMTTADLVFAVGTAEETYSSGQASDAGWFIAFAAYAVAGRLAVRRGMTRTETAVMTRWQIVLPYVPFGLAAFVAAAQTVPGGRADGPEAVALLAGVIMILLRQLWTLLHNSTLAGRLEHQAYHDPLTGLGNRALFTERLDSTLTSAEPVAIVYIDLDDFKLINDSLGHDAGDIVLCTVARRLRACFREPDTIGRLGGDEFAVLTARVRDLPAQAQRLLIGLREPIQVGARTIQIGASIGIAISDGPASPEDLHKNVDLAMYQAKAQGKNTYALFEPAMREGFDDEVTVRAELRQALAAEALDVVYRPITELNDRPVGVEALAGWDHPRLGPVTPDALVPLAERAGLTAELGTLILRRARADFAAWPGAPGAYLMVTVSPRQLLDAEFRNCLAATSGLPPDQLVLAVPEKALADDGLRGVLARLRATGVRVAVADFGSGHASLRALHDAPADILKIDRAYVREIAGDPRICEALWQLARAHAMTAVTEGAADPAPLTSGTAHRVTV